MSALPSRGDVNPYATDVAEDLIGGVNDWRNVSDVVRLTFKGLSDVIKAQGIALGRVEQQLAHKASKQEVSTSLSLKANVSEVQRSITEILRTIELKTTAQDVKILLADKVSKAELYSAVSRTDSSIGAKQALAEISDELELMKNQLVSQKDLQEVYDVCATKVQLAEIEEALHNKANKQSVATALHRKADKVDFEDLTDLKAELDDLRTLIDSKASLSSYERLVKEVALKADSSTVERIHLRDGSHGSRQDHELAELRAQQKQRANEVTLTMQLDSVLSTAKAESDRLYSTLHALIAKKADSRDLDRVSQLLAKKADSDYVAKALEDTRTEFNRAVSASASGGRKEVLSSVEVDRIHKLETRWREVSSEQESTAKRLQELWTSMRSDLERLSGHFSDYRASKATEIIDLKKRIEQKADVTDVSRSVSTALHDHEARDPKRDWNLSLERVERELKLALSHKADFSEVKLYLNEKLSEKTVDASENTHFRTLVKSLQTELERHILATKEALEELYKSTLLKANIKDVCTLLDLKANADEVSRAFTDIAADLDLKASRADLTAFTQEQLLVNEVLCAENCVGRWIWKSGALLGNYAVPWEIQSLNTCPDNFLWERDKSTIVTVTPGLYLIFWGFFTKKPPSLQLMINGEPVFLESMP